MNVDLTPHEARVVKNLFLKRAEYWRSCENVNRRLAAKADPYTNERFTGGPLEGELKTPENWIKRAELFCERKEIYLTKAKKVFDTRDRTILS